jgi:hypothetical protein
MTRFRVFLVSYLISYALVTGIGLLLQLRPWEPDTTNWVREHSQIYIFDFLVLQIPGLSVIPALLFGSPMPEIAFLVIAILLAIWTWKSWHLHEETGRLQKLGQYSFLLALAAVLGRIVFPLLLPASGWVDPLDIRHPNATMAWISFQSVLMLTLVLVHIWLRRLAVKPHGQIN